MSERNRRKNVLFWLRFGCVMGLALGVYLRPASAAAALAVLVASAWVIWFPLSRVAVPLGIALLAIGAASWARMFEIADSVALGVWAIGAGLVVLVNCRSLRVLTATLAAPTPDELREQDFEDLIEE